MSAYVLDTVRKRLITFPENIGNIQALEQFSLWNCAKLEALPARISDLRAMLLIGVRGTLLKEVKGTLLIGVKGVTGIRVYC